MDERKELTKNLIASGVKELMLTQSFEKLTIRMIAEKAGIIRPTFYYHFQDKYEVLEWIVYSQLLFPVRVVLERGMLEEALKLIFAAIEDDKEFYKKAFEVTGQNSFWEIMINSIMNFIISDTALVRAITKHELPEKLSPETVALHFAFNLAATIQIWVAKSPHLSAEDILQSYKFLNTRSIFDILSLSDGK